ncbi:hypothetical protein SPHFLASMR4Y_03097 [Sphingorhabdus sp. SMR4y]|nr:hypothetical protein SPHFLASMR4Y_03097 [Sphingorhabdus sp. SMR4y]
MGASYLSGDMTEALVVAPLKLKPVITYQNMKAFAVPRSNQPGSGLQRDGVHVAGFSGALDAFAKALDFSLGGACQAAVHTSLQAIGDTAPEQVWSDVGSRQSICVAPQSSQLGRRHCHQFGQLLFECGHDAACIAL